MVMYAYNPRKKSAEELEKSLVGDDRWDILRNILKELSLADGEHPKQHWMLVGPRGIGKSHLLTLLYHKVKASPELDNLWISILFPEELRMAKDLSGFLERAVREILLAFEAQENPLSGELSLKVKEIRKVPFSERADYLFSIITWIHQATQKFVLLVVENLQQLLGKKISTIEQKKLRAYLQTSDAVLLIGSATTVFDALHDHSQPFYHFFHIRRLEDLGFEDMKTLIANILSSTGQHGLTRKVLDLEQEARLRALYSFTGGNPRMAVFLANILETEVPSEMLTLMDQILDELTPYFEGMFGDVPAYLAEIINMLAAAYEPAQSPKEIAKKLELPQTTVRSYLKQLKENGYVRIAFPKGKSNYYCLNEYLYRIWYQMRDSSHREETRWLIELLLMLYSPASIRPVVYLPYGHALEKAGNQEGALRAYIKHIRFSSQGSFIDLEFQASYEEHILPILETLKSKSENYVRQFYLPREDQKLSRLQLSIFLILMDKYDVISEHMRAIMVDGIRRLDKEGKQDFGTLIFTIKLSIWLKLCEGAIYESQRLVAFYLEYIKSLITVKEKESEVSSLLLSLFILQINEKVKGENVQKILERFEAEERGKVPFSDIFRKIWICLTDPDSVDAHRHLTDKAIAAVIKILKTKDIKPLPFVVYAQ